MTRTIAKRFGKAVRQRRLELNMSQDELAHRAGIHRSYPHKVENGHITVSIEVADNIARALGLTFSELIQRMERL